MYPSFMLRPCTIGIVLPILINTWPSPMIWGNRDEQQSYSRRSRPRTDAPPTLLALFDEEIVTPRRRYSRDAGLRPQPRGGLWRGRSGTVDPARSSNLLASAALRGQNASPTLQERLTTKLMNEE